MENKYTISESEPLVSIVVITYNSAKYVVETLDSLKSQSYSNIELIISDDCSPDHTVELCGNWLELHKDRFVRTNIVKASINKGIPANCNQGLELARGTWTKIIAGDDVLKNSCITDNINFVSNNRIQILFSKVNKFKSELGINTSIGILPETVPDIFEQNVDALAQHRALLLNDLISFTPSCFTKKSVYESIGYFDEKYKFMEDYPFWLKATRSGIKLSFMDKVTVDYRIHSESVFSSQLKSNRAVSSIYIRNEAMRTEYIYPYFSRFNRLHSQYNFRIFNLFKNSKNSFLNRMLLAIGIRFLNPFEGINFIAEKIGRRKIPKLGKKAFLQN